MEGLKSEKAFLRYLSVKYVSFEKDANTKNILWEYLEDRDIQVRVEAARRLQKYTTQAKKILEKGCLHRNPTVRIYCFQNLYRPVNPYNPNAKKTMKNMRSNRIFLKILKKAVKDAHPKMRLLAVIVLECIG